MSSLTRELSNIGVLPADITLLIAESDPGAYAAFRAASRDMLQMLPRMEDYVRKRTEITVNDEGAVEYRYDDVLHRMDGPAVIYPSGSEWWFKRGMIHRDGDLPAITSHDGSMSYFKYGRRHRVDGPANISPWVQEWYTSTRRDRKERDAEGRLLPAIFYTNGLKSRYFIKGVEVDEWGNPLLPQPPYEPPLVNLLVNG